MNGTEKAIKIYKKILIAKDYLKKENERKKLFIATIHTQTK